MKMTIIAKIRETGTRFFQERGGNLGFS